MVGSIRVPIHWFSSSAPALIHFRTPMRVRPVVRALGIPHVQSVDEAWNAYYVQSTGATWLWTDVGTPSSLTIQSNGIPLAGVQGARTWMRISDGTNMTTALTPGGSANFGRGIVMEVKGTAVGDANPATWPEGYTWGGTYAYGGVSFCFPGMPIPATSPDGFDYTGIAFAWQTTILPRRMMMPLSSTGSGAGTPTGPARGGQEACSSWRNTHKRP
jgi:hypothetical protein